MTLHFILGLLCGILLSSWARRARRFNWWLWWICMTGEDPLDALSRKVPTVSTVDGADVKLPTKVGQE